MLSASGRSLPAAAALTWLPEVGLARSRHVAAGKGLWALGEGGGGWACRVRAWGLKGAVATTPSVDGRGEGAAALDVELGELPPSPRPSSEVYVVEAALEVMDAWSTPVTTPAFRANYSPYVYIFLFSERLHFYSGYRRWCFRTEGLLWSRHRPRPWETAANNAECFLP